MFKITGSGVHDGPDWTFRITGIRRLATALMLWWDGGAIQTARAEKARLQAEVAEMQSNRDEWAQAGFLAKLERCGPKSRPCIRVDEGAGAFGERSDYRVILRY